MRYRVGDIVLLKNEFYAINGGLINNMYYDKYKGVVATIYRVNDNKSDYPYQVELNGKKERIAIFGDDDIVGKVIGDNRLMVGGDK